MKVASLFSGSGALDLGLHEAGHELVLLCDNDPGARQVLKQAFPGVMCAEDVAAISELPKDTELVVAGFPCIDVSRAGLRKGIDGSSTGLVRHVLRLLHRSAADGRPVPWVLLENVQALLDRHGDKPPAIAWIVRQFMVLGYGSWAYRVVSSAGFGVPNRRKRVFIVASMHGDARDVLLAQGMHTCPGACEKLFQGRLCWSCHAKVLAQKHSAADVSFAVDLGNAMSAPGEDIVPTFTTNNDRMLLLLPDGRCGMLRIEDAERMQGLPEGWTAACYPIMQPGVGGHRVNFKTADADVAVAKRWDLLGNAVTVPVARWLGERLATPYAYKYHISVGDRRMDGLVLRDGDAIVADVAGNIARNSINSNPFSMSHDGGLRFSNGNGGGGDGRAFPNIWSFVTADEMQEAVVFPYLVEDHRSDEISTRGHDQDVCTSREDEGNGTEYAAERRTNGDNDGFGAGIFASAAETARGAVDMAVQHGPVQRASLVAGGLGDQMVDEGPNSDAGNEDVMMQAAAEGGAIVVTPTEGEGSRLPAVTLARGEAMPPSPGIGEPDDEGKGVEAKTTLDADVARDAHQASLLERAQRGKLNGTGRMQTAWDRDSWPRCGWWVKGLGAFAASDISDAPVLTPFQPIGEFVEKLGREQTNEEAESYMNRLKERGFEIGRELRRRLLKRGQHDEDDIVRLPGRPTDADMVGDIVWAPDPQNPEMSWPAEVLDPLSLPPGRVLRSTALDHLTMAQRRASLPCTRGIDCCCGGTGHDPLEESAADRRIFVQFMPAVNTSSWAWLNPADVEPWEAFYSLRERAVNAALRDPKFRLKEQLREAMADGKASYALKQGKSGKEVDRVRRTRAASAASAVDLKQRCGRCRTCMTRAPGTKAFECLTQRMHAAALSGHAGAQLASCGADAIGARVDIWWDGDQKYFPATVTLYDPISTEHTVAYDDGEVSMIKLWQHCERVRFLNDPEDWPEEAEAMRQRLDQARKNMRLNLAQRRQQAAAAEDDASMPPAAAQLVTAGADAQDAPQAPPFNCEHITTTTTTAHALGAGKKATSRGAAAAVRNATPNRSGDINERSTEQQPIAGTSNLAKPPMVVSVHQGCPRSLQCSRKLNHPGRCDHRVAVQLTDVKNADARKDSDNGERGQEEEGDGAGVNGAVSFMPTAVAGQHETGNEHSTPSENVVQTAIRAQHDIGLHGLATAAASLDVVITKTDVGTTNELDRCQKDPECIRQKRHSGRCTVPEDIRVQRRLKASPKRRRHLALSEAMERLWCELCGADGGEGGKDRFVICRTCKGAAVCIGCLPDGSKKRGSAAWKCEGCYVVVIDDVPGVVDEDAVAKRQKHQDMDQ